MTSTNTFNRIVFYGCSFTAGSELSDLDLFPHLTQEEITKLKLAEGYAFYNKVDHSLRNTLDRQRAWPKWFCDELNLNIQYENRAVTGSSMGQIIFDIEKDLSLGNINDDDIIVVGITSPERMCTFTSDGPQSLIFNNLDNRWTDDKFRDQFLKHIASDDYILYNWYKDIRHLDLLSSRLNGRLYQQWIWGSIYEQFEFHIDGKPIYNLKDYIKDVVNKNVEFKSVIDNNISFTKLNSWLPENKHEFNHPKLHIQQEFGRSVARSFLEKIS